MVFVVLQLLLAKGEIVACVFIMRIQSQTLLILFNRISQQLLLFLRVCRGRFLSDDSSVVIGSGFQTGGTAEACHLFKETVCHDGVSFGEINIRHVEERVGILRILPKDVLIAVRGFIVVSVAEGLVAVAHFFPLRGLCKSLHQTSDGKEEEKERAF